MAEDAVRSRASAYVDEELLRSQDFLFSEHRRHERRELTFHKTQLQGFAQSRADAEQRHWQRVRSIDEKQRQAEIALHRQHRSIGGRLTAVTKQGRARQAEQRESIAMRGDQLRLRAHRNLESLTERQFRAEQADRILRARQVKLLRQDHLDARRQQVAIHHSTRDLKVETRTQHMRDAAEHTRRQEQDQQRRQEGPTQAHTRARSG